MALEIQSPYTRPPVNIVVVGDSRTGKTSLITTFVSSIFPANVPRVLQQVLVPPEETSDGIALTIADTDSSPDNYAKTFDEVASADVVLIVYSADQDDSLKRVHDFWLPEICALCKGPIFLIGNKIDLRQKNHNGASELEKNKGIYDSSGVQVSSSSKPRSDDSTISVSKATDERLGSTVALEDDQEIGDFYDSSAYYSKIPYESKVLHIIEKFPQIEACWECSAKLNLNVSDIFASAQQIVIYPVLPLFDVQTNELKPKFVVALERIFRIFDTDHDGLLCDLELSNFQEKCFGARLQPSDIEEIKTVLLDSETGGECVKNNGITFEGYKGIYKRLFRGAESTAVWVVLRKFGYDDNIDLQVPVSVFSMDLDCGRSSNKIVIDDFENLKNQDSKTHRDYSTELTSAAINFLTDLFHQFDANSDHLLDNNDLDRLFLICPNGLAPWSVGIQHYISEEGFDSIHSNLERDSFSRETLISTKKALCDLRLGLKNSVGSNVADYPHGVKKDSDGFTSLAAWLAEWNLLTLLQPRLCLLYLYFLGFDRSKKPAITCTRTRRVEDEENNLHRNVIRAFVFGAQGVGKSSLLNALVTDQRLTGNDARARQKFASNNRNETNATHELFRNAISRVKNSQSMDNLEFDTSKSSRKYLCLTEVSTCLDALDEAFSGGMVDCDLAVLVFDSTKPATLEWLRWVESQIPESVPCVFVATKIDLLDGLLTSFDRKSTASTSSAMNYDIVARNSIAFEEAVNFCEANRLPDPLIVSFSHGFYGGGQKVTKVFELLLSTALFPDTARRVSPERAALRRQKRMLRAAVRIGAVTATLCMAGYIIYALSGSKPKKPEPFKQRTPAFGYGDYRYTPVKISKFA